MYFHYAYPLLGAENLLWPYMLACSKGLSIGTKTIQRQSTYCNIISRYIASDVVTSCHVDLVFHFFSILYLIVEIYLESKCKISTIKLNTLFNVIYRQKIFYNFHFTPRKNRKGINQNLFSIPKSTKTWNRWDRKFRKWKCEKIKISRPSRLLIRHSWRSRVKKRWNGKHSYLRFKYYLNVVKIGADFSFRQMNLCQWVRNPWYYRQITKITR